MGGLYIYRWWDLLYIHGGGGLYIGWVGRSLYKGEKAYT